MKVPDAVVRGGESEYPDYIDLRLSLPFVERYWWRLMSPEESTPRRVLNEDWAPTVC